VERKRYSRKFQRMAVARMETCEDVGELARELGVRPRCLYKWRRKLEMVEPGQEASRPSIHASAHRKEIHRLKQLLAEKTLERGAGDGGSNAVPFPRPFLQLGDAKTLLRKRKLCPKKLCHLRGSPHDFSPTSVQTGPFSGWILVGSDARTVESSEFMERAMGIEPCSEDWDARNPNKIHRTRLRLLQASVLG
jgi:transposase-like protein